MKNSDSSKTFSQIVFVLVLFIYSPFCSFSQSFFSTINNEKTIIFHSNNVVMDTMEITMDSSDVSCFGGNDGMAMANVIGGYPPYTFLWNDPLAQTGFLATNLSAGYYSVLVTDDSAATIIGHVTVGQPAQITSLIYPIICSNMTFDIGSHYYSTPGLYVDTISANNGCDSIVTTNLSVIPSYSFIVDTVIVAGDSILLAGNYYSLEGSYDDTLFTAGGCDSIFTYNLTLVAGIRDLNRKNFTASVFPNPLTSFAVVKVSSAFDQKEKIFALYDMLGKEVMVKRFNTSETIISKGDLSQGIYYFRINLSGENVSQNGNIVIQ